MDPFLSSTVKHITIAPVEIRLQKKKVQLSEAMADKSTPPPTASTITLTLLEVSLGNPPPNRTGLEDILLNSYKSKVE